MQNPITLLGTAPADRTQGIHMTEMAHVQEKLTAITAAHTDYAKSSMEASKASVTSGWLKFTVITETFFMQNKNCIFYKCLFKSHKGQ